MDQRRTVPAFLLLLLVLGACTPRLRTQSSGVPEALPAEVLAGQVEVIRTDYGVPHIYADNFKALGYALGYLQLEDYGQRVARGMLRARGDSARYLGPAALEADFENRPYYLRVTEVYRQLSEDTRDVYEGFAAGVNRYIERYPGRFPQWMPSDFDGYDVAALYIYRPNLREVRRWARRIEQAEEAPLLDVGTLGRRTANAPGSSHPARSGGGQREDAQAAGDVGSSAWALAPGRTRSNAAILMRNPHLGWDAGYWEVHVVVRGRLDFYGDFRIGGPLGIIGGFNRNLGFATTNNSVDDTEVYALEVDPERPGHYLFDGGSMPIRREPLTLTYRDGPGYSEQTRERLSTHLGPIVYEKGGLIYVIRTPRDGEFRAGEQFLRLIQAGNLEEWTRAMRLRAHPGSNFTYADAEGNIFYLWNAVIPVRPHPAGGDRAIRASRTEDVWTDIHDLDSLPQLLNPKGGYVRDENDGPWLANLYEPIDPKSFPDYFEENELSLRSQHSIALLHNDRRFSLEDVVRLKHSYRMLLADRVKDDLLRALEEDETDGSGDPIRASATRLLRSWDNTAASDSKGSVLFASWWRIYTGALGGGGDAEVEPFAEPWRPGAPTDTPRGLANSSLAAEAFDEAVAETVGRFGALDVAWGEAHRVRRGPVDVAVGGCPGALGCFRVLNFTGDPDGKRRVTGGDGWVIAVEFTDPPRAYSILGYGQSANENSPHHFDQAALFARGEMKPVFFTRPDVLSHQIRRYRPGFE